MYDTHLVCYRLKLCKHSENLDGLQSKTACNFFPATLVRESHVLCSDCPQPSTLLTTPTDERWCGAAVWLMVVERVHLKL